LAFSKQDTSKGRTDIHGFPYWRPTDGDNFRTIKIKAAKNIISLMTELRELGDGKGAEEIRTYHRAIEILKKEGEKYP
jgi:hypothetical protein